MRLKKSGFAIGVLIAILVMFISGIEAEYFCSWKDVLGGDISTAEIGDSVSLYISSNIGSELNLGDWVNFTIRLYNNGYGGATEPRVWSVTKKVDQVILGNNIAVAYWKAGYYTTGVQSEPLNYYYAVKKCLRLSPDGSNCIDWGTVNLEGNNPSVCKTTKNPPGLQILGVSQTETNAVPLANISSPTEGSIYPLEKRGGIVFDLSGSGDVDSNNPNLVWDFNLADPGKEISTALTLQTSYSYKKTGRKDVSLTLIDDRGGIGKDSTNLLVIDEGVHIYANISYPTTGTRVASLIKPSAAGSFYVDCVDDTNQHCSPQDNNPICLYQDSCCEMDGYKCVKTFSVDTEMWSLERKNNGAYEKVYLQNLDNVDWPYLTPIPNGIYLPDGEYKLTLTAKKTIAGKVYTGTARSFFEVRRENTYCDDTGRKWIDTTNPSNIVEIFSMNHCKWDPSTPDKTCCPKNYDCKASSGNLWKCVLSEKFVCSDYKTHDECSNYNREIAKNSVKIKRDDGKTCNEMITEGSLPAFLTGCRCEWDSTSKKCLTKYDTNGLLQTTNFPTCTYTDTTTDNCDDNFLEYSWTGRYENVGTPLSDCKDGSKIIPCPQKANLPFFTFWNFILSSLIIAIIYYISSLKKR